MRNTINLIAALAMIVMTVLPCAAQTAQSPTIEVTGSATVNIVPDRITIEIGMEEYYDPVSGGDSVMVKLADIEKKVRAALHGAGIADKDIVMTDMGNYRDREMKNGFLMAKELSATVDDFSKIDRIADTMGRKGISSFNITRIDNTEMERYNRQGLKAALDAARDKAQFIAETEGVKLSFPLEIVENGPNYYDTPTFSNVAFDSGAGMENMRRIVRRYSVKVRYCFYPSTD